MAKNKMTKAAKVAKVGAAATTRAPQARCGVQVHENKRRKAERKEAKATIRGGW